MSSFQPLIDTKPLDPAATRDLLRSVVDRANAPRSLVVFDLDSTLLNNAPRQAKIMRDYGREHGVAPLADVGADAWGGWDPRIPMRAAGLRPEEVEEHYKPFRRYWFERFFTSEYCALDSPIAGAIEYVRAVEAAGARVYYVTGRHEPMRDGTIECFRRHGFPLPNNDDIDLVMKPSLDEHDDDYKLRTYDALRGAGKLLAAFDNEPTHINGYYEAFPDATIVHMATDHSMRNVRVIAEIPSIFDFSAWL